MSCGRCDCLGQRPPAKTAADRDAVPNQIPAEIADWWDEEQNTENIGDEARNQEQNPGKEDHNAMGKLATGVTAGFDLLTDLCQDAKALNA